MAEKVDFDSVLYRPIAKGIEYEGLIPKPKGGKIPIGKGDTGFSIEMMVETVNQYSNELKAVAEKLQTSSLTGCIDNVKDFIYNNFQYKADSADQLLRTPSHAWHLDRLTGIDCKSYSILASCLFTEMGIVHYIRKIKQPTFEPTAWTHVYVIVPVDQDSGGLQEGHYTVDGTLLEDYEPAFTESSDVFMDLQHYRLNAPAPGLGLGIGSFDISSITSVKSLFNLISCLGGTTYNANRIKTILTAMNVYFNDLILEINTAAKNGDAETFADAVAEYNAVSELGLKSSQKYLTEGWNACSSDGIKTVIKAWEFFNTTGKLALNAWLDANFVKDPLLHGQSLTFNTTDLWNVHQLAATADPFPPKSIVPTYYNPKAQTINAFELTPYLATATSSNFNPLTFIEGLTTVLTSYQTGGNNPNNPNNTNPGAIDNTGTITPTTTTAGGGLFAWAIGGVAVWLFVKGLNSTTEDKPNKLTTK